MINDSNYANGNKCKDKSFSLVLPYMRDFYYRIKNILKP